MYYFIIYTCKSYYLHLKMSRSRESSISGSLSRSLFYELQLGMLIVVCQRSNSNKRFSSLKWRQAQFFDLKAIRDTRNSTKGCEHLPIVLLLFDIAVVLWDFADNKLLFAGRERLCLSILLSFSSWETCTEKSTWCDKVQTKARNCSASALQCETYPEGGF